MLGKWVASFVIAFVILMPLVGLFCSVIPGFGASMKIEQVGYAGSEYNITVSSSLYTPSKRFCAVNETPLVLANWEAAYQWVEGDWLPLRDSIERSVEAAFSNITSIRVEIDYNATDAASEIELLCEYGNSLTGYQTVSNTSAAYPEHGELSVVLPGWWTEDWGGFRARLGVDGAPVDESVITGFRIWMTSDIDLYPLAVQIVRPNGENLQGHREVASETSFEMWRADGWRQSLLPWHIGDQVFLEPGVYSIGARCGPYQLYPGFAVGANLTVNCRLVVPAIRIEATLNAPIPGYGLLANEHEFTFTHRLGDLWHSQPLYIVEHTHTVEVQFGDLAGFSLLGAPPDYQSHYSFSVEVGNDYRVDARTAMIEVATFSVAPSILVSLVVAVFCAATWASIVAASTTRRSLSELLGARGRLPLVLTLAGLAVTYSNGSLLMPWESVETTDMRGVSVSWVSLPWFAMGILWPDGTHPVLFSSSNAGGFWPLTSIVAFAYLGAHYLVFTERPVVPVISVLGVVLGVDDYVAKAAEDSLESLQFGPGLLILLLALIVMVVRWNYTTGPLAGRKSTIMSLLSEYDVTLAKIRAGATRHGVWSYDLVWVTWSPDPAVATVRAAVEESTRGVSVKDVRDLRSTESMVLIWSPGSIFPSDRKRSHRHRAQFDLAYTSVSEHGQTSAQ